MNPASLRRTLLALLVVCLGCGTNPAAAFEFGFSKLCCYKTTEPGADEVYLLVFGRSGNGQLCDRRLPADRPNELLGHWSMHAGVQHEKSARGHYEGKAKCITDGLLFEGDLAEGETWTFLVFIMEEDGGTTKHLDEVAPAALAEAGDLWTTSASGLLDTLARLGCAVKDSDDYIGSFAMRVTKSHGQIQATWAERDHATSGDPLPPSSGGAPLEANPAKREFRFDGDDSNYTGNFYVR
jgi:hypothetical protein